jgi:hypothetical protein
LIPAESAPAEGESAPAAEPEANENVSEKAG